MIPTFLIDWPVLVLIGLLFGYGVREGASQSLLKARAFLSGTVVIFLFIGLVYYSYLLAPDWMWMYFARAGDFPAWFVPYIFFLYYGTFLFGFFLKQELEKIHVFLPVLMILVSAFASFFVTWELRNRYLIVATYEQFHQGQGVSLAHSPVGQWPAWGSALLLPLGLILIMWSRRQKRRLNF